MENDYQVFDGVAVIFLRDLYAMSRVCMIDANDLPVVDKCPTRWHASKPDKGQDGGYVVGWFPGKKLVPMHRFLMGVPDDAPRNIVVDHINHNTFDNRRSCNLRVVTNTVNLHNRKGPNITNIHSGVMGVQPGKKKGTWRARFQFDGIRYSIGTFANKEEAFIHREIAVDILLGKSAQNLALQYGDARVDHAISAILHCNPNWTTSGIPESIETF